MGWASGSRLYSEIITALQTHVPNKTKRQAIHKDLILAFEAEDWDTEDECLGEDPAFDAAMNSLHPDSFSDE